MLHWRLGKGKGSTGNRGTPLLGLKQAQSSSALHPSPHMRFPLSPPLNKKWKNSEFLPKVSREEPSCIAHPRREGSPAQRKTPKGGRRKEKGFVCRSLCAPRGEPAPAASLQVGQHSQGHSVPEQAELLSHCQPAALCCWGIQISRNPFSRALRNF